jgi:hypothetical protein
MKRMSWQSARPATACRAALLPLVIVCLAGAQAASAQTLQQRLDAVSAHMTQLQNFVAKLPASERGKLSSGTQHQLYTAQQWDQMTAPITRSGAALNAPLQGQPFAPSAPLPFGEVSDPGTDLVSRMTGFTQSETSTAWCGSNVLVTYNDSGSFLETFPVPNIGLSFNGYSLSTDRGRSFTDLGYLNPGPSLFNFLGGDPVAVCTDQNTFYYSSIFQTGSLTTFLTGVSVSKSTDGGRTFADPVAAILKDGYYHFIDKPWMAADPSNPNKLYVTYTDFDVTGFYFANAICPGNLRLGIELVASTDGGITWSSPRVIDAGCYPNQDQGSNVAVDGTGKVFVAWEQFPAFIPTNELDIVKSTDGGATFSPKVAVAIVTPVGHSFFGLLQGGFRNNEFPSLAIDRSRRPSNGTLYIAWNDGRLGVTPDSFPPGFVGITYNFGDAFVTRSSNGGATWAAAVKVNDNSGATGSPADHYLPGIAVDSTGRVGVCFYDRRHDTGNFFIDRECASSRDGGHTWVNQRVTESSFSASIAADLLINSVYMGDYDGVTADSTARSEGFFGAYGSNARGNPDVVSARFGD